MDDSGSLKITAKSSGMRIRMALMFFGFTIIVKGDNILDNAVITSGELRRNHAEK